MTTQLQLNAMLEYERARTKHAFSTNAYSGPMNPTISSGASFMPPSTAPGLRAPIAKTAGFKLEGDAVIEVGKDGKSLGKGNLLEKRSHFGALRKIAAGAPTRGGFMMASDIPPMTAPSLRAPVVKQAEGVKAAEAARVAVQEASAALHKVGQILTKVGDSLPDYVTYNSGDFTPAKLNGRPKLSAGQNESIDENAKDSLPEDFKKTGAGYPPCPHCGDTTERLRSIPTRCGKCKEKVSAQTDSQYGADTGADVSSDNYLRGKEKDSDVSPSVSWNGGTGAVHRQESFIPAFHQTSLRSAISKTGAAGVLPPPAPPPAPTVAKTVGVPKMPAPGPSIADIAKPKGAGFGTGIAGAFKPGTGIGGTGPVSLSASPGSAK